jgi:hypothetical protein
VRKARQLLTHRITGWLPADQIQKSRRRRISAGREFNFARYARKPSKD